MAKAPVNRNPAKVRHGSNMNRPNGAAAAAASQPPRVVVWRAADVYKLIRQSEK